MRENDKQRIIERYDKRLGMYGYDPRTLGWFKGRQKIRFRVLSEVGDMENCTVLDVGCGFGDLFDHLRKKELNIQYTGCDINKNLVNVGKKIYPEADLMIVDIVKTQLLHKFDWVVSSGVFNVKLSNSWEFIKEMIQEMFLLCRKGVAVDFISDYVDYRVEDTHYTSPEKIFKFCKSLTKFVLLRHDYMPFEFCVYMYKCDVR